MVNAAMDKSLNREAWLAAARRALLKGGVEAVRVAKLARDLHVTKGSFYWHFRDRDDLLQLLLQEWEGEAAEITAELGGAVGQAALEKLMDVVVARARLSEEGLAPSDAAIFAWASVEPRVARRVQRAERERIDLLVRLMAERGRPATSAAPSDADRGRAEILYLAWLGFVARGQRVPALRKRFPEISRTLLDLVAPGGKPAGKEKR
jgi:AcrR family transcriptional regulator